MPIGVDVPRREKYADDAERLAALSMTGNVEDAPCVLALNHINLSAALFQPRCSSIAHAPGTTELHIQQLARVPRTGEALDPILVVAFGDKWFLVDGHCRLGAYKLAKWKKPIPVRVLRTELRGRERVEWAVQKGFDANRRNRLPISDHDRSDHAWRLVVANRGSKAQQARASGRQVATIGNMRKVAKTLLDFGISERSLLSWEWSRAWSEFQRISGEKNCKDSQGDDQHGGRVSSLAQSMKPAMRAETFAKELIEALEAARPGLIFEIAEAIEHEMSRREWTRR